MRRYLRVLLWSNVAWMAFVWINRLRNIGDDDDLSGATLTRAYVVAIAALVGALVIAVTAASDRWRPATAVVLVLSIAWWVVRAVQIALADHSVGFIIVHTVLAVVSISLAVGALIVMRRLGDQAPRAVDSAAVWDSQ